MFIKFTDIITQETITINSDNLCYILHLEYGKFSFMSNSLQSMLTSKLFSDIYYNIQLRHFIDDNNIDMNYLIFMSDITGISYDKIHSTLAYFVDGKKHITLKRAPVCKLQMTDGKIFYCDEATYNVICNNNENLVIEK